MTTLAALLRDRVSARDASNLASAFVTALNDRGIPAKEVWFSDGRVASWFTLSIHVRSMTGNLLEYEVPTNIITGPHNFKTHMQGLLASIAHAYMDRFFPKAPLPFCEPCKQSGIPADEFVRLTLENARHIQK